jgi:hypothetical protein
MLTYLLLTKEEFLPTILAGLKWSHNLFLSFSAQQWSTHIAPSNTQTGWWLVPKGWNASVVWHVGLKEVYNITMYTYIEILREINSRSSETGWVQLHDTMSWFTTTREFVAGNGLRINYIYWNRILSISSQSMTSISVTVEPRFMYSSIYVLSIYLLFF